MGSASQLTEKHGKWRDCAVGGGNIMSYSVTLKVPNISCHHCTNTIVRETKELPGVIHVEASVESKTATYTLEDETALGGVRQTLVEIGYPAE
jgi:copper chaperone CopZ